MSIFSKLGALIFAPTDAAGNPRQVINHDAQVWSTEVERIIQVALEGGDLLVYGSLSALNADLDHPAHTGAILIGESIADDGLYMKQGASGSGSWVKIGNVPGQGFVKATNAGAGTANAIAATTPVAVNETQLILLPITAANTASPVTVAFNSGAALTVKTVSGNDVAVGGLPAGSVMLGVVQGGDFRLLSDQASAGIQAAAEAAQVAAEAALAEMREKSVGAFPDNASAEAFLTAEGLTKQKGTIYFNTTADVWRYWDGSAWQTFPYAIVADGGVTEEKLSSSLRRPLVQPDYQDAFRKRIIVDAPLSGGDYDTIISTYGYTSLFPQGFCLDEDNNRLFVLRIRDGGANDWSWIEVWDYTSLTDALGNISFTGLAYNRSFAVDVTTTFTESIVVLTEGANRFLYVSGEGSVHKYDITSLPTSLTKINPSTSTAIDAYSQIAYRNGRWAVMLNTIPLGGETRRNHFGLFNSDFTTRVGTLQFNNQDVGPWVGSGLADYFPKNQGIAMGEGFFACAMGGNHFEADPIIPYAYQGIKLFDSSGRLVSEGLVDPEEMISKLEAAGYPCSRIETEGCYITRSGQIISMYVHLSPTASSSPDNDTGGLMFFEEYSKASDAMDLTDIGRTYPKFCEREFDGVFPRSPDGIYNPITGAKFTTVVEICNFMRDLDISRVSFYTTAVPGILDVNGDALPSGGRAVIENNDNNSFDVNVHLFNGRVGLRVYNLTTTPAQNDDPGEFWGTGNPNGIITADVGAIYRRRDGGVDFAIFTKTSGSGTNTGWSAVKNS